MNAMFASLLHLYLRNSSFADIYYFCDMKRTFFSGLLAVMILLIAGCTEGFGDSAFKELSVNGPDGKMEFTTVYYSSPLDIPGCSGVLCHTNGKDVFSNIWLSFYFNDNTPLGGELQLERLNFGAGLSSDIREYTSTFTGKMELREKTDSRVIIYMDDVHFKIQHGEYVFNGNLVAKIK